MALLMLYFFLVLVQLRSYEAQTTNGNVSTTDGNTSPTATMNITSANGTAQTPNGNASTTDGNTSPTAQTNGNTSTTNGNISPTAQTPNGNVSTTDGNTSPTATMNITSANGTAQTTVGNASTTAEMNITSANATVGPGCSGLPVLCCPGRNDSCSRGCFCDEHCMIARDCCSDFNFTCAQFLNSTNSSTTSPPPTATTVNGTVTSNRFNTSTSTSTDFQPVTLHLKVSLLARDRENKDRISEALSNYLSNILLQQSCENCMTIKKIKFN